MGHLLAGVGSQALAIPSTSWIPLCHVQLSSAGLSDNRYLMDPVDICNRKIPTMLADHVEKNNLQGKLKYSLFVGASSGAETENRWAALNMIERRAPHQVGKAIAKGINNGNIKFFDKHLSMFPVDLVYVSISPYALGLANTYKYD